MNEEQFPKMQNRQSIIHLNLAKCGLLKEQTTILWPGNPIDGKTMFIETNTPKKKNGGWGKASMWFYLDEKDSPIFDSPDAFIEHYKNKNHVNA